MSHTDVLNYIQVGFHSSLLLFNNSRFAKYSYLIIVADAVSVNLSGQCKF